ncbi:MAG TPA: hypothetical protein VLS93_13940 [Anaeromyxobacteraceae bacterium]|nr:hypothetical protein [Anaeromyxobacteraceae bacterium]
MAPDYMRVVQLNGGGEFVATRYDGSRWYPVLARWEPDLVTRRLTQRGIFYEVGDFEPLGLDDNGIVVGRTVIEYPPPGQGGVIHFGTAWLDSTLAAPVVHTLSAPGARTSQWLAVSRSGGWAVGDAYTYTPGACQDAVSHAASWSLLGGYDQPAMGPVMDATSIPCRGCKEQPAIIGSLGNTLVAVNDAGEAVGTSSARDADWFCRLVPDDWGFGYDFEVHGIREHPVYVGPGGGITDLGLLVAPIFTGLNVAGIDNAGEIAGTGWVGSMPTAFRYDTRSGATVTFPWVPGATSMRSRARQINNQGHVLANLSICYGYNCYTKTVVWSPDDQIYDLGEDLSWASLNDRNEVVGSGCRYDYGRYVCSISNWQLPPAKLTVVVSRADGGGESTTFAMLPSVISSTYAPYVAGEQGLGLDVKCVKPSGEVARDCEVSLGWRVETGSGGHVHDTNRPPGLIQTASGRRGGSTGPGPSGSLSESTGSSGTLGITYVAPEACGITRFEATGTATVDGQRLTSDAAHFAINVKYDGLARAAAPGLSVAANSTNHGTNNGYATPAMAAALARMASAFAEYLTPDGTVPVPVPAIRATALSLPFGGLFDFETEWQPPHEGHRFGTNADVGMAGLTGEHKKALEAAIQDAEVLRTPVESESPANPDASHWHLSL